MNRKFEGSGITVIPTVTNGVSGFLIEMTFQNLSADPGMLYTFISESEAMNLVDFILKMTETPEEPKKSEVDYTSDLVAIEREIAECIQQVRDEAEAMGISPYAMRDVYGRLMLHDLIIARANLQMTIERSK